VGEQAILDQLASDSQRQLVDFGVIAPEQAARNRTSGGESAGRDYHYSDWGDDIGSGY
jgi:hypothetical protein